MGRTRALRMVVLGFAATGVLVIVIVLLLKETTIYKNKFQGVAEKKQTIELWMMMVTDKDSQNDQQAYDQLLKNIEIPEVFSFLEERLSDELLPYLSDNRSHPLVRKLISAYEVNKKLLFFGHDPVAVKSFLQVIQAAIRSLDQTQLIELTNFPLAVSIGSDGKRTFSAVELEQHFNEVFNPNVREAILAQEYSGLFVRDQGVMIGNGQIWFDTVQTDLKIISIHANAPLVHSRQQ